MNQYEKQHKALEEAMREHVVAYQKILDTAKAEDHRNLTDDEAQELADHLKAVDELKLERDETQKSIDTFKHVEDIGRSLGPALGNVTDVRVQPGGEPIDRMIKSIGEQFTDSAGFKSAQESFKGGGQTFTTGPVSLQMKGTLLSQTAGSGQGLIPVPQVIPGVVETLFQPLTVENLLLSGQTETNSLRYIVEGTATSGAAAVAEAGSKPESTLGLSTKDEPVKKLATVLVVSDEMLEDVSQVQSYINGRLSLFVRQAREASIVSGAGTNDLVGITNNGRSINIKAAGTVDNNAVALFKAMNGQRGSAFLEPDFIVMNPANWQTTRLLTDTAGQFFGGGPFQGQYGAAPQVAASGFITGAQDTLWGKPVVISTSVGSGTALIGTSSAAQVWSRGGLTIEATNSHSTYFTSNLVAIRAESRLALAVYRPSAFTMVTGLS